MPFQKRRNHSKRAIASAARTRESQKSCGLELRQTLAAREIERLEQIRRQLEESRDSLAAVFEQSPVGYMIIDQRGHIRSANAVVRSLLGFEQDRLLHLTLVFLVCREDVRLMSLHLAQIESGDKSRVITEVRLSTKSRQLVPVQLNSVPFAVLGNRRLFLTAVVDLTERSRNELALADAKEFAEAIVHTVRHPLAVLDSDLHLVSVNRAFAEFFKRPAEYLRGRVFEVLLNLCWSGNQLRSALEKVLARNHPLENFQITIAPPEIGRHVIFVNARRLYQKGKTSRRILIALEDITEREQARADLRTANEALEERVAARTQALRRSYEQMESFCYSIAHDLRSPLRSMTGFSKLLASQFGEKIGEEGRSFADRIAHSAERMDNLIQDLLQYGRLNTIDLPMQEVDMDLVFKDVLVQLEKEIEDRHARIRKAHTLPFVRGNRVVLHAVLLNLISNALKFVPTGAAPEISVRWDRSQARLWIKDNGIGIAAEHQERIFGVFQRLHHEDAYPGTGIGLALVSKGVERIGGRVGVESELGKGSHFWVELKPVNNHCPA